MKEVLIWMALIVACAAIMSGLWLYWRRGNRAFATQQAERAAEHDTQMAELARQRHLRELDERRRGLLRGRTESCRFCGVEQGCLTPDNLCLDVEACLTRAGESASMTELPLAN